MVNIHINIGSNQNRLENIAQALSTLKLNFFDVVSSSVFESPAYGFEGDDFYNIGVNASTDLKVVDVVKILRDIEDRQGRDRTAKKFLSRSIDLDLVLYDGLIDAEHNLPRDDILNYNFVLLPLAELSPDLIHPQQNKTYAQLLATMDGLKSYNSAILTKG